MKVLYAMAHSSDRLADERAGHVVRPRQLLTALQELGHSTSVLEAAAGTGAQGAARSYWRVRDALPDGAALVLRDTARVVQNERFGRRLLRHVAADRPDVLLETQVAFSTAGAEVAAATGVPLLLDDVSPASEDEGVYDVRLRRLARRRRTRALRVASLAVVTSERLREELLAEGVPGAKVVVVPNAVPPAALTPDPRAPELRAELGFGPEAVVVAYVGSFQPFHRVALLVEALARPDVPAEVHALAVGDGDQRREVEDLATSLGVRHRVRFTGRVPSDQVGTYLQVADVAVLPATAPYTNPMKLYDYLASGRPVVAPDQRAVTDLLGDAPASLFTPDSAAALAASVTELARDRERRQGMGAAALEAAHAHTWTHRAAQLVDLAAEHVPSRARTGAAAR